MYAMGNRSLQRNNLQSPGLHSPEIPAGALGPRRRSGRERFATCLEPSALIAFELLWGWRRGRNTYRLNDALGSLGLGVMSQVFDAFGTLFDVFYRSNVRNVELLMTEIRRHRPG